MKIHPIHPDEIMIYWSNVADRLSRALLHGAGESKLCDWHKSLVNGTSQLWILTTDDLSEIVGVVLTQILTYARHKTLHVVLHEANDFKSIAHLHADLERFALEQGCIAIEQWGRRGWAKTLPKEIPGYKEAYVVMRKELNNASN
jgi:hypothetical protein